jgi:CRP-like cAMP-binding protein
MRPGFAECEVMTSQQTLFFRKIPIFGGLEGDRLNHVVGMLEKHTFPKGSVIFSEGELGRTMYIIEDGVVEIAVKSPEGAEATIVTLGPGEVFGEMSLVELQPRAATVKAGTKAVVYSMNNLDLYKLYQTDNYAYVITLQNICRMLSRRLRKADSRIAHFLAQKKAVAPKKTATRKKARR